MPEAGLVGLPAVDRVPVPWRNGRGTTAEVIVRGAGPGIGSSADFGWRISIATVESDGDFSRYPGVDRWLMPLCPGGLRLVDDGAPVPVGQYEVHAFPGERALASDGVTTPTLDLNLMLRRGETTGSLHMVETAGILTLTTTAEEELVVIVLDGNFAADFEADFAGVPDAPGGVSDGPGHRAARTLGRHDAVFLGTGGQITLHGTGRIAVARIASFRV
jgi:environmental stress-induced protein Ves